MITLTLLHPLKSVAVQKWQFEPNSVIKIGRANDNNVILYSAVVSRHHLEIRSRGTDWILMNVGANGTFVNGKKINKVLIKDGMIFRVASSGPKIMIKLKDEEEEKVEEALITQTNSPLLNSRNINKETVMNSN